jgi:hypothetical protein
MARSRFNDPIEPMTLGNMRANGVRSLDVSCWNGQPFPAKRKKPPAGGGRRMPHFMLTFGDASRAPVGLVIIEAPSMFEARMTAVVRRLAAGVPIGESHELSARMMTLIPPALIGRMMSGAEATQLLLRLVEGRRSRPGNEL